MSVIKVNFEPNELTKQSIKRYGKRIAVACSFGKDSMVILDMARKVDPNVLVIFENTGVEFPETIKFKNEMIELWNLNVIETKPYRGMSFWKCVKKYGLPKIRHRDSNPKCCFYLKEKPAIDVIKKHGVMAILTGIMASESWNRTLLAWRLAVENKYYEDIEICPQRYYTKGWGVWKFNPIIHWTEKDVWNYTEENDIPINPVYTKWGGIYKRCGCLPCTAYKDWEKKLSISHPKLFKMLYQMKIAELGLTDARKVFV